MGYYSQHAVEDLQTLGRSDPELTTLSLLTKDVEAALDEGEIRGLLDVPLTKLSGGQLVRLALARLLWQIPQLLILDKITTHLDFHTVRALTDALGSWNGAILCVSHDRFLIRRVVEGEKDEVGSKDKETEKEEEVRRRNVFLLKEGSLKVLVKGVSEFEESLEKKLKSY
jgi:ATPase subunit of ABC transporter with duplicated ATPase domains